MTEVAETVCVAGEEGTEKQALYVSPIATPLITGKLLSRVGKLLKKATAAKGVKRGIPEVVKLVRKGKQGVVILAGDIFPVDLVAHVPVFCEEKEIKYVFVESRRMLADFLGSKRPVSIAFVQKNGDAPYDDVYSTVEEGITAIHPFFGTGKAPVEGEKKKKRQAEEAAEEGGEEEAPKKKKKKKVAEE